MLEQLRAAIVAVLNGANIGTFYPKERFSKNMNTLKDMYGQGEGIAGGYIRLKRRKRQNPYATRTTKTYTFDVVFLQSFVDEDSSQVAFEDAIDALDDAFAVDPLLSDLVDDLDDGDDTGLILDDQTPVMFCGVLCHQARMHLTVNVSS
ncbi:MAG: hypothetical protein CML20_18195 [Rheinheimera sp.]|nr:hypothetical protein [Rheinheimera sp.]|tara:strand:+ start:2415 stop:2861 length:447 start_codon:yes stop_codon:yes gene_type:complete